MSRSVDTPAVNCPTGNCTWPIVPTVGVCGACTDLTNEIKYLRSSDLCALNVGSINMTGYCSQGSVDFGIVFEIGRGPGRIFDEVSSGRPDGISADSPNLIASWSALGLSDKQSLSQDRAGINGSSAAECALWYCLQAHEVKMDLGELRDTTTPTWNRAVESNPGSSNGNITFANIPSDAFNADPAAEYGVSVMQMMGMQSYTNKTFLGNASADAALGILAPQSDFAGGMQRSFDDLDSWIERLARSMTNEVRLNGTRTGRSFGSMGQTEQTEQEEVDDDTSDNEDSQYRGSVFVSRVIIVVRWPWITYAVGLVLISVIYLVFEVVRTSRMAVRPWKSDALLPVCMDIGQEVRVLAASGMSRPNGVKEKVGKLRARLTIAEDGNHAQFTMEKENAPIMLQTGALVDRPTYYTM